MMFAHTVQTYDVYNNYVYTLSSCDIPVQFFDVFYKF